VFDSHQREKTYPLQEILPAARFHFKGPFLT
jgi:hypothetical protein